MLYIFFLIFNINDRAYANKIINVSTDINTLHDLESVSSIKQIFTVARC